MKPHHRAHAGGGHGIGGLEVRKNITVHFSWKSGEIARMKWCFVNFSWDGRRNYPKHCHPSRRSENPSTPRPCLCGAGDLLFPEAIGMERLRKRRMNTD
jgi:hypothetical protein